MPTNLQIKAAAPADKACKVSGRDGLYLVVLPSGAKSWRYHHLVAGKTKTKTKTTTTTYGRWPGWRSPSTCVSAARVWRTRTTSTAKNCCRRRST